MLDKEGIIEHSEVFKAICNGFDIDLQKSKNDKGETSFIDI